MFLLVQCSCIHKWTVQTQWKKCNFFIRTQWLFGSFCPLSATLPVSIIKKTHKKKKCIPNFSRTTIIINRQAEATLYMHHGEWERCHEKQHCLVLCEWVDKCYMSASCLKTLCMISLSSGPTEITAGDERWAGLSQQTAASRAHSTVESCNLESNELSLTTVSLSERRGRDGSGQKMSVLCSKLMHLWKSFQLFVGCNSLKRRA